MNRYVSTSGTDSGPGSFDAPWASLVYAGLHAEEHDNVFVLPGTYNAGVVCTNNYVLYEGLGEVHIVGDGFVACFYLQGSHHIVIKNFDMTNNGGSIAMDGTFGIFMTDFAGPGSFGCNNIYIDGCTFHDFNKDPRSNSTYAVDIGLISYSNELNAHQFGVLEEGAHHIVIQNCTFYPGWQDMGNGTQVSHIAFNGNVKDVLIKGNTFNHTVGLYPADNGCIEWDGNYVPQAYPAKTRRAVICDNVMNWTGTPNTNRASFYPTGCSEVLIERNILNGWPAALYIVDEEGIHHNITSNIWVRRNKFLDFTNGIFMGTFLDTYLPPANIWYTNNTMRSRSSNYWGHLYLFDNNFTAGETGGISGDNRFSNNLMVGPGPYIVNLNVDPALITMNYNVEGGSIEARNKEEVDTDIPPWYTPGLFGDYEPALEKDFNGSTAKNCIGADDVIYRR